MSEKALSMLPRISRLNSHVWSGGTSIWVNRGFMMNIKENHPRKVRKEYKRLINIYGDKAWDEK